MDGYPAVEPGGLEFLVGDLQSWAPGQIVRVAFLGGSAELHKKIAEATQQIADAANLTLVLQDGDACRTWTEDDTEYAAEIRVSFDQGGFFSLVGTDSASQIIGSPGVAGRRPPEPAEPEPRWLRQELPPGWKGTVRHEFLHALAFHHEHQNMRGPCEMAFRWDDDPGYQPTTDARGTFVPDAQGRRPGIYTYLSGHPNSWPRAKVDHNLRTDTRTRRSPPARSTGVGDALPLPAALLQEAAEPMRADRGRPGAIRGRRPGAEASLSPGDGGGPAGRAAARGAARIRPGGGGRRPRVREVAVGLRRGRDRAAAHAVAAAQSLTRSFARLMTSGRKRALTSANTLTFGGLRRLANEPRRGGSTSQAES